MAYELPTVEEAQAFLAAVNRGRVACGLGSVEFLDFDGAVPMHPGNCLSARNLFAPLEEPYTQVVTATGAFVPKVFRARLAEALGADSTDYGLRLPDVILSVTDPFDYEVDGLRDRLVEAGVVE